MLVKGVAGNKRFTQIYDNLECKNRKSWVSQGTGTYTYIKKTNENDFSGNISVRIFANEVAYNRNKGYKLPKKYYFRLTGAIELIDMGKTIVPQNNCIIYIFVDIGPTLVWKIPPQWSPPECYFSPHLLQIFIRNLSLKIRWKNAMFLKKICSWKWL